MSKEVILHGFGSGGAGLNFKIVGGTSQPASASENTIWVNTDVEITSYSFSAAEPETPVNGMVWITIGRVGNVEFNALKKNDIQVYPLSAKQYVSGAWVDKTAKIYQGGAWKDWIDGELFVSNMGALVDFHIAAESSVTITIDQTQITWASSNTSEQAFAGLSTAEKVDITDYSAINLTLATTAVHPSAAASFGVSSSLPIASTSHTFVASAKLTRAVHDAETYSLDISGLRGSYYVCIHGALACIITDFRLVR